MSKSTTGDGDHLLSFLQESDEEDEIADAETLQKRRDQAALEWRKNSKMTPEENPNFEVSKSLISWKHLAGSRAEP